MKATKNSVLIVGYGVVGHNLAKELAVLEPDIYDKYHTESNTKRNITYDFAFICVDTPVRCDTNFLEDAISETKAKIYIIKSTVLPGTTERFSHAIFSPEYYGSTQHCNNFNFNFTILGGEKSDCLAVQQLLQNVYDGTHTFRIVDARTAELVKFMENSWLATKVSFCGQFYEIAEKCNVNYEELRELFILDPRVNPSHTFIYKDHPYWDSHCLNKDVPAIAEKYDAELLKAIIEYNKKRVNG